MSLPVEDMIGLIGSILLLWAPGRDQVLRILQWFSARSAAEAVGTKKYWDMIGAGFERKRNAWSFWDSATMAAGAILIGLSYIIQSPH